MRAKFINETFDDTSDPIEDLSIGLWKPYNDIIISLDEFKEGGGKLTKGRELYDYTYYSGKYPIGYWIGYDDNQHVDLMRNDRFKSCPVYPSTGVKVKTKVLYK